MSHPHHRVHLPPIPDLRFEPTYLRSIAPYIQPSSSSSSSPAPPSPTSLLCEKGDAPPSDLADSAVAAGDGLVASVQWGKIAWVTARDQILSPFLQGAIWGIASPFVQPVLGLVTSRGGLKGIPRDGEREGTGVGWLRNWLKSLGFGIVPARR